MGSDSRRTRGLGVTSSKKKKKKKVCAADGLERAQMLGDPRIKSPLSQRKPLQ